MKDTRDTREQRRARRKDRERRRRPDRSPLAAPAGPGDRSILAAIVAAAQGFDAPMAWPDVGPRILPVLRRAQRAFPRGMAPVHVTVPPGITTGFGIDFGPAFGHVSEDLLVTWGVDRATLLGTALENLRRVAMQAPPDVQRFAVDGAKIIGIQGQGWGSSLILLPEVLGDILGRTPRVLLAPVRNTVLALEADVDASVAIGIWHALADGAPDELDVEPLRWTGTTVATLADDALGRPN